MSRRPGPLLLLHPAGALGTARSAMLLADVTPALQAEADHLRAELQELARPARRPARRRSTRWKRASPPRRPPAPRCGQADRGPRRTCPGARRRPRRALDPARTAPIRSTPSHPACRRTTEAGADAFSAAKGTPAAPGRRRILRRPGRGRRGGRPPPRPPPRHPPRALVTAPVARDDPLRGPAPRLRQRHHPRTRRRGISSSSPGLATVYGDTGNVVAAGAPLGLMGGPRTSGTRQFDRSAPRLAAQRSGNPLYRTQAGRRSGRSGAWFASGIQ